MKYAKTLLALVALLAFSPLTTPAQANEQSCGLDAECLAVSDCERSPGIADGEVFGTETYLPDPEVVLVKATGNCAKLMGAVFDGSTAPANGAWVQVCHIAMTVCAWAQAHASHEKVKGMPNVYTHATAGGGFTTLPLTGSAVVVTSLGNGNCGIPASGGCGLTWTDVASACKGFMWSHSTATVSVFVAATPDAIDAKC